MGRIKPHLDIAQLPYRIADRLGCVFPEADALGDVYARLPATCRPLSGLQSIFRQQLGHPFTDSGPPPLHQRPFDDVFVAASMYLAHAAGVAEIDLAALYLLTRLVFVLKATLPPDLRRDWRLADFRFFVLANRLVTDVRRPDLSDAELAGLLSRALDLSGSSWATRGKPIFFFPSTPWQRSNLKSRCPERLARALAGQQKIDRRVFRTDEELRGLITLIGRRLERREAVLKQLGQEIRRIYGLPRRTPVTLPERLSHRTPSLHLTVAAADVGPKVVVVSLGSETDYLWPFGGTSFYPSR